MAGYFPLDFSITLRLLFYHKYCLLLQSQYSHRCTNAFTGALSHFVLTSQFHKIQETSEIYIGKNREGEVFYLMIISVDEIL